MRLGAKERVPRVYTNIHEDTSDDGNNAATQKAMGIELYSFRIKEVNMFKFFTPTDARSLILFYSRTLGSDTFNFYVKGGRLLAEVVRDGISQPLQIQTMDIPFTLQADLNEEKLQKLMTRLEQSSFDKLCGKLLVKTLALGGWEEDVHRGYRGTPRLFDDASGQEMINYSRVTAGVDGTFKWAVASFSMKEAKIIADACQAVDEGELCPIPKDLSPTEIRRAKSKEVQSWHFNTNFMRSDDYSFGDSRVVHAVNSLQEAIQRKSSFNREISDIKQKIKNAKSAQDNVIYNARLSRNFLKIGDSYDRGISILNQKLKELEFKSYLCYFKLGEGLHPLQDMYAHTEEFVKREGLPFQFHTDGCDADKPLSPSGKIRIKHAEIATKLYLAIFNYNVDNVLPLSFNREIVDYIKSEPQYFLGLIRAFNNNDIILLPNIVLSLLPAAERRYPLPPVQPQARSFVEMAQEDLFTHRP
ncbi:MAG: hypothetical protein A2X78_00595 [Gammaproteobacteria bacterium GWE2_37_16]|nr:MAG: hypothetical protein A2X78_00595 [Gammaproteobacteria bacterium GWE2_37_16]